jgi:hypothetical protein
MCSDIFIIKGSNFNEFGLHYYICSGEQALFFLSFNLNSIGLIDRSNHFLHCPKNLPFHFLTASLTHPPFKMNTDVPGFHRDWTSSAAGLFNRTLRRFPAGARGHIVAVIGEFVGTTLFLFFAIAGTQVASISSNTNTGGSMLSSGSKVCRFHIDIT